MKIDLFNINKFIEANHCMEVTSSIALEPDGSPTADGIFSEIIFGQSIEEQQSKFGYIDLHCRIVNPTIYLIIKTRIKKIFNIIQGTSYAKVNRKTKKIELTDENDPDGDTGIEFLYNNFEYIEWISDEEYADEDSLDRKTRLKFLQLIRDKDEFFVDKWLVLPRYYRDYSSSSDLGPEMNKVYKELINKASGLKSKGSTFSLPIFRRSLVLRIQDLVLLLYHMTMKPITGKSVTLGKGMSTKSATLTGTSKFSLLRRHGMGKFIDYSASSVIVVSVLADYDKYDDARTRFGYSLIPLMSVVSLFKPFFVNECNRQLERIFYQFVEMHPGVDFKENQFSPSNVEKMVTRLEKSPDSKDDPVYIETESGNKYLVMIREYPTEHDAMNDTNYYERPYTLFDMLYQSALEVVKDKTCLITRYPIANHQNLFLSMINVASTDHTHEIYYSVAGLNIYYDKYYPYVPDKINGNRTDVPSFYYDTTRVLRIPNAFIKQLGADYDGDMLYMRGLFTKEANTRARQIIFSKQNLFNVDGSLSRGLSKIGKESVVSLYEMTK